MLSTRRARLVATLFLVAGFVVGLVGALGDQIGLGRQREYFGRYQFIVTGLALVLLMLSTVVFLLSSSSSAPS